MITRNKGSDGVVLKKHDSSESVVFALLITCDSGIPVSDFLLLFDSTFVENWPRVMYAGWSLTISGHL